MPCGLPCSHRARCSDRYSARPDPNASRQCELRLDERPAASVCRWSSRSRFLLVAVQDLIHLLWSHVEVEVVVYLYRRSPATSADAFDFFERKRSIRGDFFMADAQLVTAMIENLFGTPQHAANVRADLYNVLTCGLGAQQGVIADDIPNFQFSQINATGNVGHDLVAQIAYFVLSIKKHRDERRALPRVLRNQTLKSLFQFGRVLDHRSISPRTISILPIAATTSASKRPTQSF